MTDKFAMHDEFPMGKEYQDKASERGFTPDSRLYYFEEWREYWSSIGAEKTARGWLQCWDNNLKRKAKSAALYNGNRRNRFERRQKNDADTIAPGPRMIWIGGRGYGFLDILPLKHKQASGARLDPDEQRALEAWNG